MNILVIEDERRTAEMIIKLLKQYDPSWTVPEIIGSVEKGIQWFTHQTEWPDLILADIQLTDGTSFDLFERVNPDLPVIFITAYNEFVLRAFRLNSIDYLLKPLNYNDLKRALDKFIRTREIWLKSGYAQLRQIISEGQKCYKHRFLVKSGKSYKYLSADEIAWFAAEEGIVFANLKSGGRWIIDDNITDLNRMLDPEKYFQINRSTIIHIDAIDKISDYFNRRLMVRLLPGNHGLIVSRERSSDFKNWLDK